MSLTKLSFDLVRKVFSITRSEKFLNYIWKSCSSQINVMSPDVITPWGFQEAAGEFSAKDKFDFSGTFCGI